jgi:hypothetical protein
MNPRRSTLQATLELFSEGETPTGALITPGGQRREFSGWIEMASAIEDWRHNHRLPADDEMPEQKDM